MRVAVTGGSGFIGSHVVDHCRAAGHETVVIDRAAPHRSDVDFRERDLLDEAALADAIRGCDTVFHLAAVSNVNVARERPVHTVELNILGTARVLEAARRNGVRRVVFASTVWVYSGCREECVSEETPFHLAGAGHIYTSSKIAAEMICHDYRRLYDLSVTILRYGIPYGPRMREELLIPIFIRKALAGEPLTVSGDGAQYRNFVYIDDLARANLLALSERADGGTYNLEGPSPVTVRQVAEAVRAIVGPEVQIVSVPARPGDYGGKTVDATRAERELGWKAEIPFEEGMRRTVAWYRQKRSAAGSQRSP